MSKRESRKRINRRRKTYRKAYFIASRLAVVFTIVFVIAGLFHVFTDKKEYRDKGIKLYEQGEYEEAIKCFDDALDCNQWFSGSINVDIELYKADCYLRMEDFTTAGELYGKIMTKYSDRHYNKKDISFLVDLCAALEKFSHGDYVSTVACFIKAVESGYTELSIYAAICYENQRNYDKMKEYFDIYVQKYGMSSYLYYKYASYYILQGDYDTAQTYINQGISQDDTSYLRHIKYIQIKCYAETGNYEHAYELAGEYVAAYPDDENGRDIYAYLDTRVNPNTTPVNDIFGAGGSPDASE